MASTAHRAITQLTRQPRKTFTSSGIASRNETFSLFEMDLPASITQLSPALPNSKFGTYAFYHDQFASLYSWRNIGTSDYNALQVTYNVHGANLQGQFNYTFSKSFDEASAAERIGPYEGTGGTGNEPEWRRDCDQLLRSAVFARALRFQCFPPDHRQ